jgi:hypothetical protein
MSSMLKMRLDAEDASGFPTLPPRAPNDRLVLVRRVTRAALPVPLPLNDRMQPMGPMTGHFRRRKCADTLEAEGTLSRCQNWVKMLRAAVSSAVSSWEVLHSRRACGLVQGSVSRLEYSGLYLF